MFGSFKLPHLRRKEDGSAQHERLRPPRTPTESPKNKRHLLTRKRNSDSETCPSIASLRPGSVALASDQLTPGDRIHSVNGISTTRMRPDEVSNLLEHVDGNALLEIEYCLPSYASQSSLCVSSKVTEVQVERIDGSLGITLRGGFVPDHPHLSRPLIITQVRPNGPAYLTGLIRVGDRLLKVDNYNLTNKTLLEAQKILKDSSILAISTLTIEYDVSIMESVKYATGPLLVEIDRNANEDLGLLLSNCSCDFANSDEITAAGVYVEHIIPASTADRCGALGIGDQLLAIDEVCLDEWRGDLQDATCLLKTATKIQIMPLHALQRSYARGYNLGPYGNSPTITGSGFSTLNSKRSRGRSRNNRHSSISKNIEDNGSTYCGYTTNLGVCHSETLSIQLVSERGKGYGLSVAVTDHDDSHPADIIIARIVPDSPAFRCGCLQTGDRITSINHRSNLTLQEVNAILEMGCEPSTASSISSGSSSTNTTTTNSSTSKITLQIEFDVADTIIPTTGIFTVKLARRGPGLGITITASKSHPEDPFIVSEIRRGSVAHRTGTLHAGDRLLAIDNRPLDHLTVETAFDILQTSSHDIVTLKVEKTELANIFHDTVVYTVELLRHGGPLGITIAGSEDCSEPITLSKLTEGGLAEKTGALHVGDRLIAINNEPLDQKPLSEAIRLLQTSGDRVQLKIARNLKSSPASPEEARCNYSSPGLTSIDSAVHSWDSNPPESAESIFDPQIPKDFESVLSEPLSYQEQLLPGSQRESFSTLPSNSKNKESLSYDLQQLNLTLNQSKHDSQRQFYSDVEDVFCPSPLPLPNFNLGLKYDQYSQYNQSRSNFIESFPSDQHALDTEIYHVTLYKDSVYDDYGFSVSDGLYEKGVYINRIRKGGPADIVGMLRPFDRIIQVNDTKTQDFDCCLTVPLIASAGDRIDMVIARNPFMVMNASYGVDGLSRKSFSASNNTITKTL